MRPLAGVLATLLAFGPAGCAHRGPIVPLAPEPKPEIGTVGLVVASSGPNTGSFQRPGLVGSAEGAKAGARAGVFAPAKAGLVVAIVSASARSGYGVLLGLMVAAAGLVVAPVSAGVGAAVGAIVAPSRSDVEQSGAALERAVADANLPDALTAWIIEAGGRRPIVPGADPAGPMVDTFLEIDTPYVALSSNDPTDWTPELRLRLSVRARLVRASDSEELRTWSWEQEGPKATFVEWGRDDARMLRAELERAGRALAAKVIADLY